MVSTPRNIKLHARIVEGVESTLICRDLFGVWPSDRKDRRCKHQHKAKRHSDSKENDYGEIFAEKFFHRAPERESGNSWRSAFLLATADGEVNLTNAATAKKRAARKPISHRETRISA